MPAGLTIGVKPREPRTKVLVPCRLKSGRGWSDACIHNISSRGLLIGLDDAPENGSYVDIRRGTLVIVGRVVWSRQGFIGIRTQDKVSVAAVVNEPRVGRPGTPAAPAGNAPAPDRRAHDRLSAQGRLGRRVERNRQRATVLQFGAISLGGVAVAIFAAIEVRAVLAAPLAAIGTALGSAN
ncbi:MULTISPECIES: PilZ domain-containing protein [unclassified Sphingomonas]|uniref:PilZ domain-containing protein n=1 Tax=unclassified Sphingomonas TaxID=196159 RepID=UPI00226ABB8E